MEDSNVRYFYYDSEAGQRKLFKVGNARNFIIDPDNNYRITIILPTDEEAAQLCPSGTRFLFFNKSFADEDGMMHVSKLIDFECNSSNGDFESQTPFQGVSQDFNASVVSGAVPAYSFSPVYNIQIGNGFLEVVSMPNGEGVDWVVTRISSVYQNLS